MTRHTTVGCAPICDSRIDVLSRRLILGRPLKHERELIAWLAPEIDRGEEGVTLGVEKHEKLDEQLLRLEALCVCPKLCSQRKLCQVLVFSWTSTSA